MKTEFRNLRRLSRLLLGLSVALCLRLIISGGAHAMLYRTEDGKAMWDPGVFWHDGTYYLFAMYGEGTRWPDARYGYLAHSKDGVHWEHGWITAEEREWPMLKFFKGYIAWVGDRFVMNHGVAPRPGEGQDTIRFYESKDLKNWRYLYDSHPDPEWYLPKARWDDMYFLPKEEGNPAAGFWGIATAVPAPPRSPSFGLLESSDGVHYESAKPPEIEWGDIPPHGYEAGGCERIGGRYYYIGGTLDYLGFEGYSVFCLWADDIRGPFRPDPEAYRLCGTSQKRGKDIFVTTLASWGRDKDNAPVISNTVVTDTSNWLLPIRKPVFDDGHLRLGWWKGNEALKGKRLPLTKSKCKLGARGTENAYDIIYLDDAFNLKKGVLIEGAIKAEALKFPGGKNEVESNAKDLRIAAGFVLEEGLGQAMAIELGVGAPAGRETHIGRLATDESGARTFTSLDVTGKYCATVTGLEPGKKHTFRLLLRLEVFELYIDDLLMQTYLYRPSSGKLGFLVRGAKATFSGLKAWEMNL